MRRKSGSPASRRRAAERRISKKTQIARYARRVAPTSPSDPRDKDWRSKVKDSWNRQAGAEARYKRENPKKKSKKRPVRTVMPPRPAPTSPSDPREKDKTSQLRAAWYRSEFQANKKRKGRQRRNKR